MVIWALLSMGRWIHAYIYNQCLRIYIFLENSLIDMYFKCMNIEVVLEILCTMPSKNILCWNSIIIRFRMHGYGQKSIEMFLELYRNIRIKLDEVTFVWLLFFYSHSGLISEHKRYFLTSLEFME